MARVGRPCPSCRKGRDARRPSSSARGYGSRWRRGLRARQLRLELICQYVEPKAGARCSRPATDVDHIVRKSQGGADALENLQSLCHEHHSMKTASETGWGTPVAGAAPGRPRPPASRARLGSPILADTQKAYVARDNGDTTRSGHGGWPSPSQDQGGKSRWSRLDDDNHQGERSCGRTRILIEQDEGVLAIR